jgi:hypothetical protein
MNRLRHISTKAGSTCERESSTRMRATMPTIINRARPPALSGTSGDQK